jgi:hypothetical protein
MQETNNGLTLHWGFKNGGGITHAVINSSKHQIDRFMHSTVA